MVNGKHGDHPYTDITLWRDDLGEPEIAELVHAIAKTGNKELKDLVADLLMFTFPAPGKRLSDYHREAVTKHLKTIKKLAEGRSE